MAHREIMIVRHGQAYNTVEPDGRRVVVDRSNPPLTPYGEAQAVAAAHPVAEFGPDVVVASPFLRASQTAFAYLSLTGSSGVADVRMSEHFVFEPLSHFQGVDLTDYRHRFGDQLRIEDNLADLSRFPHFPEADALVEERVADLFAQWQARSDWKRAAFYGHGATVGALARLLAPSSPFEPAHCSISHFVEESDGWKPVVLNGVDHLADL